MEKFKNSIDMDHHEKPFFEVLFLVTVKCNCHCIFCCEQGLEQDTKINELLSYIDPLIKLGVTIIDINGGEPLVRKDEVMLLIKKISDAGAIPSISSNITLLSPEVVGSIKKYCKIINCSLHGSTAQTNDYLMQKPGAFNIITKNIKLLVEKGIDVHVTCVVVDENFLEIEQIAQWCYKNGVRSFCMNVVFGRGKGQNLLKTDKVTVDDITKLKHKIRSNIDLSKINIYVNYSRIGQCILLRPGGDLCGAPENPKSEKDGLITIGNIHDNDIFEKCASYKYKLNHSFYNYEKFSPYLTNNNKEISPIVYYNLPDIVGHLKKYIEFVGLVGSFAVNEQSLQNGKFISDIDYYIVLKKKFRKNNPLLLKFVEDNKHTSNYPLKSFWLVEYDEFYGGYRRDTLTPYQLAETRAVLFGEIKDPDDLLKRPIEFNSHLGLCGVAYMDICNGIDQNDFRKIIKGVFNQIGVILISHNKYATAFRDRITSFIKLYPAFVSMEDTLLFALEMKKNCNSEIFIKKFKDCNSFFEIFKPLFSISILNQVFATDNVLHQLFQKIDNKTDVEQIIRLMYLAFYFKDINLLEKINKRVHFMKGHSANTLDYINQFWANWLTSICVFENFHDEVI